MCVQRRVCRDLDPVRPGLVSERGMRMSADPIVVGTDGSSTAERAVDTAGQLAAALDATVHVVMSYRAVSASAGPAACAGVWVDPLATSEASRARAESAVAAAQDRLEGLGVKVWSHVCEGDPAEALIAAASQVGAQMIVVGNKGMMGARRVLGSVPNRVSHHAHCSVLIVQTC
jgi:nucleotide-binding universal stress UspA family protein